MLQQWQARILGRTYHNNSATKRRGETDYICKVQIQRDKTALFSTTGIENQEIGSTLQSLIEYSVYLVTGFLKYLLRSRTEVFVQFEFHAAIPSGTSTKRSRDISAPYAMAARMSSSVR